MADRVSAGLITIGNYLEATNSRQAVAMQLFIKTKRLMTKEEAKAIMAEPLRPKVSFPSHVWDRHLAKFMGITRGGKKKHP